MKKETPIDRLRKALVDKVGRPLDERVVRKPNPLLTKGILHKRTFGIYHWDTFDNETILIAERSTLEKAIEFVQKRYAGRIDSDGADQVDIVDRGGNIVWKASVR